MKNFTKALLISSVISSIFINNSYGMAGDPDIEKSNFTAKLRDDSMKSKTGTSQMVTLDMEEEEASEEHAIQTISMGTRIKGYGARCSTIACTTFIGGSIGFGIMTSEFDLGIAYQLVKGTTPVLIGSLVGYTAGWVCGNILKLKIAGRC